MIQFLYKQAKTLERFKNGPIGPYIEPLSEKLFKECYDNETIRRYIRRADKFGRWLVEQQIEFRDVNNAIVIDYISSFQRLDHATITSGRLPDSVIGIHKVIDFLRQQEVIPLAIISIPSTPIKKWLNDFDEYLNQVVGLAVGTRQYYVRYSRKFMETNFDTDKVDWASLTADDIIEFVREEAEKLKKTACQAPVTAIRAFLRYLTFRGVVKDGLVGAVPTVRQYKFAALPLFLSEEDVEKVLESCDLSTAVGQRDHAIITTLARLGLRAGEVAILRLDDIDWSDGKIIIRTEKSRRERSLPLPQDVGNILVSYLKNRALVIVSPTSPVESATLRSKFEI